MITQRYLEHDGDRALLRLVIRDAAAIDILTTIPVLAEARTVLRAAPDRGMTEYRLGSFGPLDVTVSTTDERTVAIAIDGPDLGNAFRGNQAVVCYVGLDEMVEALRADL